MADVVQNAVNEANRKIVDENSLKLALEPADPVPGEQGRGREGHGGQGRPRLHGRPRGAADLRARRPLRRVGQEAGRRAYRRRGPRSARAHGRSRTRPSRRRARAPRRPATGSSSTSSARSTARRSRAARATDIKVDLGSNSFIPGFEDQLVGAKAGDTRRPGRLPGELPAAHLAGKDAAFDVTVKEVAGAGRAHDRRRARQGFRHGDPRQAEGRRAHRDPARLRGPVAAARSRRSSSTPSTPNTRSSCRRASSSRSSRPSGRRSRPR